MKQRAISAVVALSILAVVLFLYNTIFFNIAIALVGTTAVFELLHPTGYVKSKLVLAFSLVYAFIVPFFSTMEVPGLQIWVSLSYFAALFAVLLGSRLQVRFEEIATAFFISLVVPIALAIVVLMRDRYDHGLFYTFLICIAAWISDTAAYFTGRFFGKHKLAPLISPKKTVEGAVGGVAAGAIFFLLSCFVYQQIMAYFYDTQIIIIWYRAIWVGMFCSAMGVVGDLMASVVKRQTNLKDFGKIMPGHGGVMDRFDSFLFVAPTLYLTIQFFPIIC